MAAQDGQPVMLDATALGASFLAQRFPTIDAACRARGFDWSKAPIPVTPAAHYWMGGVRTDTWGRTSIPGLFAVGEVACTGVHGANRLASNSLLESLVFAWRCAGFLLNENADGETDALPSTGSREFVSNLFSPSGPAASDAGSMERLALQTLMWNAVGIERDALGLEAAQKRLDHWQAPGASVHDLETANLLALARVMVAAALARCESRGAHFREDFPQTSPGLQHSLVYSQEVAKTVSC
jgi:L-aspartate oxidase